MWCTLTRYNRLTNIKTPSRQILFADIYAGEDSSAAWGQIPKSEFNNSMWNWPGQWSGFEPSASDAAWTPPDTYGLQAGEIDFARDKGRAKVGFLDGHVASIARQQLAHRMLDPRLD